MQTIEKRYIIGEDGKPVAVVIDIDVFREIEEILEDIEDVRIAEARLDEPDISWEKAKKEL
jgi:hypothetical protein